MPPRKLSCNIRHMTKRRSLITKQYAPKPKEMSELDIRKLQFIKEFQFDLDHVAAAKRVGLTTAERDEFMSDSKVRHELTKAVDHAQKSLEWNKPHAQVKFLEAQRTLLHLLKSGDSRVASAVAQMARTELESHGMLIKETSKDSVSVEININLGNGEEIKSVEGEIIDVDKS